MAATANIPTKWSIQTAIAQALAEKLGAIPADNETITRDCDVIFLGVKPQTMAQMLLPLQPILAGRRTPFVLVSMAAGVTIEALQDMAGGRYPVVRFICPAKIGNGCKAARDGNIPHSQIAVTEDLAGPL